MGGGKNKEKKISHLQDRLFSGGRSPIGILSSPNCPYLNQKESFSPKIFYRFEQRLGGHSSNY